MRRLGDHDTKPVEECNRKRESAGLQVKTVWPVISSMFSIMQM